MYLSKFNRPSWPELGVKKCLRVLYEKSILMRTFMCFLVRNGRKYWTLIEGWSELNYTIVLVRVAADEGECRLEKKVEKGDIGIDVICWIQSTKKSRCYSYYRLLSSGFPSTKVLFLLSFTATATFKVTLPIFNFVLKLSLYDS